MVTVVVFVGLIALLYAIVSAYLYRAIFERDPSLPFMPQSDSRIDMTPWGKYDELIDRGKRWFQDQTYESVEIKSRDGLVLKGKYLPRAGAVNTILLVHGYRAEGAEHDFACALKLFHDANFNLLLIEHRAHARSEGHIITFGIAERLDVLEWLTFLNARYAPRRVVLHGISMGAATVLMTLDQRLPANVVGAIADCGYTSPRAIIRYVMTRNFHLPSWSIPGAALVFRMRTGLSLDDASALESVKKARIPVLFIHGEDDQYVPCEMGRENYAACASEKTLVTVPGAGHGVSFLVDPEKCAGALDKFLQRVLQ